MSVTASQRRKKFCRVDHDAHFRRRHRDDDGTSVAMEGLQIRQRIVRVDYPGWHNCAAVGDTDVDVECVGPSGHRLADVSGAQ